MATHKFKRYAGGGSAYGIPDQTESERSNEAALDADLPRREMMNRAYEEGMKMEGPERSSYSSKASDTPTPEYSSRGDAFKAARASGAKTFMYNGKSYTTEMAGESKKAAPSTSSAYRNEGESVKPTGTSSNEGRNTPAPKSDKYETPYDRMNRRNAEAEANRKKYGSETKSETARLAKRAPYSPTPTKPFMMAKGGMVSSASKRADGIATKGKTRGKMC
jgi:hypothetical protein